MFNFNNEIKPCVSVILPCYNVEKYLREALDSVLAQSLTNIEIIPVDDGSPDNCSGIIKEYAKNDSRIKPIFKENGGYGSAVNAGLLVAQGEYIAILEPDDYVMEDYYYILYNEAKKDDLDVCGVNGYCEIREMEPPRLIQTPWIPHEDYLSYEDINELLSLGSVGITLKVYRREFLEEKKIQLKEDLRAYHDVPFVTEAMLNASHVRIIVGCGYFYRKDNIVSTTKSKINFYNILKTIEHVLNLQYKLAKERSRKSALYGSCISHLLFYYKRVLATFGKNTAVELLQNKITEIVKSAKAITVNESHKNILAELLSHEDLHKFRYTKSNVIPFSSCPSFNKAFFENNHDFSTVISQASFYTYYAIALNNFDHAVKVRNELYNILNTFIGIRGKYIDDFIVNYLQKGWFRFPNDWNQLWYLSFVHYKSESDPNFIGRIYESVSHANSMSSSVKNIPKLAIRFDNSYSTFNDEFRKSKIVEQFSLRYENQFLNYIRNKSIAIVGNAPSELGFAKGVEIDSHDVVVRFNNFSTDKKYISDYGKKTNVWAITPSIESLYYPDEFYNFQFVLTPDLSFYEMSYRTNILYNYLISGGKFFRFKSLSCRQRFNINVPSVGLYFLNYLSENLNKIGKISIYGFSSSHAKMDNRHYYNDDPAKTAELKFHDWDKEEFAIHELEKLFFHHNKGII